MATQRRKATGSARPGPQTTDRSPSPSLASGAASSAASGASSDLSARSKRQWPTRESQARVLAKRRAQHRDSDLAGLDPAFEQSASGSLTVGSAAMSHYRFMDGVTNGLAQDQLEGCTEWDVCRNRAGAGGTPWAVEPEAGTGNLKFEQGIVQQNQEHDDVSYLEHPLVPLFATTRWVRVRESQVGEGRRARLGGARAPLAPFIATLAARRLPPPLPSPLPPPPPPAPPSHIPLTTRNTISPPIIPITRLTLIS